LSPALKILFATDIHGSDSCFKKFINAGSFYGVDVLVMGGDLTGKIVVPFVAEGAERWRATLHDREVVLEGDAEVEEAFRQLRAIGRYPFRTTREELATVQGNPEREAELFLRLKRESLERWIAFAEERLSGTGRQAFIMAGNDDDYALDEVLRRGERLRWVDGQAMEIADRIWMASIGVSTPTPWRSPREVSEERYGQMLEALLQPVPERAALVLNTHVPPHDTRIDVCPAVDDRLRVVYQNGEPVLRPVGSTALRALIERRQPTLGLHGHVHEGKGRYQIRRTVGFNPGSDYTSGALQAVIVALSADRGVLDYAFTVG
jgi:Icc-related predicted phosphoesterase